MTLEDKSRIDRYEAAVFPDLSRTSLTFAFEIEFRRTPGAQRVREFFQRHPEGDRVAFRLRALIDRLVKDNGPAFQQLVEPVRSFLDDVTTGPPGTNGRPFLFLASGEDKDSPTRRVWFHRGESWHYEYEGDTTVLHVPETHRRIEFSLRDSFCAFDSGRIFYLFTLTQAHEQPTTPVEGLIDEYALLQLQQLALSPDSGATDAACGGFSEEPFGDPLSLIDFVRHRLRELERDPDGPCNGIRDIIRPYGLAGPGFTLQPVVSANLHRLCIGIESDELFAVASCAIAMYESGHRKPDYVAAGQALRDRQSAARAAGQPVPEATPASIMLDIDATWSAAYPERLPEAMPHVSEDGAKFERPLLAIAGLVQGVPDFPAQDDSEISDSTRQTAHSVESALFMHPRMLIEVAKSWRSYQRGRASLGTCPYLLLTFLVAVHDELVVSELEQKIEEMIYAAPRQATPGRLVHRATGRIATSIGRWVRITPRIFTGSRSRPMADVRDVLDRADEMFLTNVGILESNIRRRLELFRWASVHRSGNVFRYPKETAALSAVRAKSGTASRFTDAHDMVDRIESLVEDVSGLRSSYAERRTNTILFILAIMGIVQLPNNLVESMNMQNEIGDLYRQYLVDPIPINGPIPLGGPILKTAPSPSPPPQESLPSKSS